MAELADAHGSGPCSRKRVEVRLLSAALRITQLLSKYAFAFSNSAVDSMRIVRFVSDTDLNADYPEAATAYGIQHADGRVTFAEGELFAGLTDTGNEAEIGQLLAPLTPPAILCIGMNYAAHAAEGGREPPERPVLFMKMPSALQDPGKPICLPRRLESQRVDYEAELVVVIGKRCKNVSREDALDYVLGYTCGNDVSARDWQRDGGGGQWCRGKTFDTFAPLGPCLVTSDEIPDPGNLRIGTTLNGETMQDAHTSDMIFSVPELIEFLSASTVLAPGTAIFTGTPQGVGFARKPPRFLQPGDQVTIEIEKIGKLSNPVQEESELPLNCWSLPLTRSQGI